jgi:predicted nucleotidyltransferase
VDLQQYLSHLMGRPVDLIERDALDRPRLREAVLRDAVEVIA